MGGGGGWNDATRGLSWSGNYSGNTINYITIQTTGNATDFGDLATTRSYVAGCGDGTYAMSCAGLNSSSQPTNTIEYSVVQTTGNASDFGDLNRTFGNPFAASNGTYGVVANGQNVGSGTNLVDMSYFSIGTSGSGSDFGDLVSARTGAGGGFSGSPS